MNAIGEIRVGTSGWRYPAWRKEFYPAGLVQRRELEYLSGQLNAVEINGSFYSLQRPERYRAWFDETPAGFVFSVKGGRFITHLKQLRDVETALANFYASGVLALGAKLGPILWQLPPRLAFDPDRVASFFASLPRTTTEAARLGARHDTKLKSDPYLKPGPERPIRHALEVRHPSFTAPEALALLREHDIALVVADTAGRWPYAEDQTTDFTYVRLHGDTELYTSGYPTPTLRHWAAKITDWHDHGHRDVHVYFDNDVKVEAPRNARELSQLLGLASPTPPTVSEQ
ncbi:DUF72 domain-containing protein [Amycolatopsis sp. PS_44_ISF1]|uniref:DUF72 domain-containing protein n=1 Tax=Amycolatopsis sp. PS_44_ISF1 TaxID=2974917 RepID=UPI0028DE3655|nr:DUF72 domain-containing protein [Amycolatopsis sp. PS_44_ISF1]MDT8911109.1 DUF72 domain-containing protein [Amycolatopsis sp. PS_44_ISF1]